MKIHKSYLTVTRFRTVTLVRAFLLVSALALGLIGPMFARTSMAITATEYCAQFTSNAELNACKSGIRGAECSDYEITHSQQVADICRQAANAKKTGQISDEPVSTPPPTTGSGSTDEEVYRNAILNACAPYKDDTAAALWCLYGGLGQDGKEGKPKTVADCLTKPELQGSTRNQGACINGATAGQSFLQAKNGDTQGAQDTLTNGNALQDILDQTQSLSQMIDVLHQLGPNADVDTSTQADNNHGSYVNGAGKQQPIKVWRCVGGGNCPALIWFNGGGWHANDGNAEKIALGQSGGDGKPPVHGGANQLGYTVIEVTYRLGSSGVYYMLEDVLRGIQHVRNNAGMYGIDANKIAIGGDSAGGSLALRAGATGKSGAKVMVGWSAPTNAFTALFKSFQAFAIGLDHSTCIPTDLAGFTNFTDLLNGGSGNVAEYGQGLSSNDFTGLGIVQGPTGLQFDQNSIGLGTITEVLTAAQYAMDTGQNIEAISSQIEGLQNGDPGALQGFGGSIINLSSKKLVECIDNIVTLSPALFASPDSPPGFLAGFDNDGLIDPSQLYEMRDKLLGLGVKAHAEVLQGDPNDASTAGPAGAGGNHLGYDPRFVCPMILFLNSVMQPEVQGADCTKPAAPPPTVATGGGGGGGGAPSGGGGGTSSGGAKSCDDVGAPGSNVSNLCHVNTGGNPQQCDAQGKNCQPFKPTATEAVQKDPNLCNSSLVFTAKSGCEGVKGPKGANACKPTDALSGVAC